MSNWHAGCQFDTQGVNLTRKSVNLTGFGVILTAVCVGDIVSVAVCLSYGMVPIHVQNIHMYRISNININNAAIVIWKVYWENQCNFDTTCVILTRYFWRVILTCKNDIPRWETSRINMCTCVIARLFPMHRLLSGLFWVWFRVPTLECLLLGSTTLYSCTPTLDRIKELKCTIINLYQLILII